LLASVEGTLGCELVALFAGDADGLYQRFPDRGTQQNLKWVAPGLLSKKRRIVDLHQVLGLWETPPAGLALNASDADLLQLASQAIIQRSLEEHSAFLSAVIDASPVSVAIAEADGDMPLIYVNDAFTTLFPIRDANGVARQIVATQTDATQRINAEIERDNARLRLEGALSATSEGFMVIGARGTIRFVNAVFHDVFGHDGFQTDWRGCCGHRHHANKGQRTHLAPAFGGD